MGNAAVVSAKMIASPDSSRAAAPVACARHREPNLARGASPALEGACAPRREWPRCAPRRSSSCPASQSSWKCPKCTKHRCQAHRGDQRGPRGARTYVRSACLKRSISACVSASSDSALAAQMDDAGIGESDQDWRVRTRDGECARMNERRARRHAAWCAEVRTFVCDGDDQHVIGVQTALGNGQVCMVADAEKEGER